MTAPATPPSTEPDPQTREEQRLALTSKLAASAAVRSLYVAERERDQLKADRDGLIEDRRELQARIDRLSPEHAALKQAYRDSKASNGLATVMMAVDGTLVSVAGPGIGSSWKVGFTAIGLSSMAWGVIVSARANWPGHAGEATPRRRPR